MRAAFAVLFVTVGLTLSSARALAQETTGTIEGQVVDAQGLPIPSATVSVSSGQGVTNAVTDSQGRFRLPFLTPGVMDLKVGCAGFKTVAQKGLDVRLGQTITLNLQLEVAGLTAEVEVQAEPPIIDTTTTTVGANLDIDRLTREPVGRRVSDALYLAPGVASSGSAGAANPSIAGGSGLDNQYVIDGVNVTNTGFGGLGSYSIVFGSLGTATPFDFVKEVQVKTGGFEAEFGQATGGLVNVVTKSGTNAVQGSAFGYVRPVALEGSWKQYQSTNGSVNTTGSRLSDGGIEIGGPVRRDRLFFFLAIDPSREHRMFVAPPDFPLASLGDVSQVRRITNYAAKATWRLPRGHRFDASFFGDPAAGANGPQRLSALLGSDASQFSKLDKYGGQNQTVSYHGALSPHWLLEASFARARNQIVETPSVDAWRVQDRTVTPTVTSGGIGFFEKGNDSLNRQYQAKATHVLGDHEIKYGFLLQDIGYSRLFNRTGPTFVLPDGRQTATGAQIIIQEDPVFGPIYRVSRANLVNTETTSQTYASVFVQDAWRFGRWTLLPGLRYEQQKLTGTLESMTLNKNWGPRLGATVDPTGTGKSKVFASWGRFFAQVPNDLAARALSSDAGISRADYFDSSLTHPVPEGVTALGVTSHFVMSGISADLIDPNAKSSYVDEALAGFEYEVRPGMTVGASYTHRSIPRVLEDVGPYALGACDFLGVGCSFDYTLTNPGPSTSVLDSLGAMYEKPIHRYDAVTLRADRRFSDKWALQGSYTWSRLRGTFEGFYRADNGQSDPGITSLYDFPTQDSSYTAIGVPQFGYQGDIRYLGDLGKGPLPLDRPHQIKIYGNYTLTAGLNLGLGMILNSGVPLTALASNPNYTNGGEIPLTPRGAGFQTVDGFRTRTPFEYYPDAHADYAVRLTGHRRLVLVADVFNFLNLKRPIGYDNWSELSFGVPNPDFGKPLTQVLLGAPPQFQTPLQTRIGARFEF